MTAISLRIRKDTLIFIVTSILTKKRYNNRHDRTFLLSVLKYHQKNFEHIISTLLKNDYPIDLIFNIINARSKIFIHKSTRYKKEANEEIKKELYFLVYITIYSKNFRQKK